MKTEKIPFKTLQDKYDYIVRERDFGNKTFAEIADTIGLSAGRVNELYNRESGRNKIKSENKEMYEVFNNNHALITLILRRGLNFDKLKELYAEDSELSQLNSYRSMGANKIKIIRDCLYRYNSPSHNAFRTPRDRSQYVYKQIKCHNRKISELAQELRVSTTRIRQLYEDEVSNIFMRKHYKKLYDLFGDDDRLVNTLAKAGITYTYLKRIYLEDSSMRKLKDTKGIGETTIKKIINAMK